MKCPLKRVKSNWVTEVDGAEVRYTEEPLTTFGQRFVSGFIMILPVEQQL